MPQGQQAIRGKVKPQRHQMVTVHAISLKEREARRDHVSPGFWTAFADPQNPRTDDFYAEVARRAAARVNKAEKPDLGALVAHRPRPKHLAVNRDTERDCAVCGETFIVSPKGPHGLYCSQKCNKAAWAARKRKA